MIPPELTRRVQDDLHSAKDNGFDLSVMTDLEWVEDLLNCTDNYHDCSDADLTEAVAQVRAFASFRLNMKQIDPTITKMYLVGNDTCLIVKRLMFHWTLLVNTVGNFEWYDDRWCYQTQTGPNGAQDAAERWIAEGTEEPTMWHRHHKTSRRRPHGDATLEYIAE